MEEKTGEMSSQTSKDREKEFRERKKRQANMIYKSMIRQLKVPKRFRGKTFDNYEINDKNEKLYRTVKNYVDNFEDRFKAGNWLMLVGSFGLGKTHLALAAAKETLKYFANQEIKGNMNTVYSGRPKVKFISSSEMIQNIRDSYDSDQLDEKSLMDGYKNTSLLVIDDLGTEKASEWQQEKMYIVLDYRYRELLPTIITTNLGVGQLQEHLSERVVERIIEATEGGKYLLNFEGKSYRRKDNND